MPSANLLSDTNLKLKRKKTSRSHEHPDHSESLLRLKKVQGQVEGIVNMINHRRYCPDIIIQLKAAISALKSVEGQVLERHLSGCIQNAVASKDPNEINKKINELVNLYMKGL